MKPFSHNIEESENLSEVDEAAECRNLVRKENRKKKSGGFQSMGLSWLILKGILHKGYKVPTPIQRKTIPIILEDKDVVAMARTGSGKTAAFLVPMFEKLKNHCPTGVRAVVLSPTRELAMQTFKFAKELGKYTNLKYSVILGGDKIEDQFATLHENPDIVIATPGRLMHVLMEMKFKLHSVEYIVFDEADRLFEMGFQEQLQEIISRIPESRQTLLFSATLPKVLVDFASAGLNSPELIRLDVDSKLSSQLSLCFLQCRSTDKLSVLMHLMRFVIKPVEQTLIFVATKHHVEYINMILSQAGYSCSISYSSLDPLARKLSVDRFRNKITMVMIVTDLAARGIDIPLLDNVINFNFPAKPKLFLHRVGRVARAGRSGTAYSLVCVEEKPFVLDLHLFLGRPLNFAKESFKENKDMDKLYGLVPQTVIDDEEDSIKEWHKSIDVQNMLRVSNNAYKHYLKSRPAASAESIKRIKKHAKDFLGYHPLFGPRTCNMETEREKLLTALKTYKPDYVKATSSLVVIPSIKPITNIAPTKIEEHMEVNKNGKKRKNIKDESFYLDYVSKDYKSEQGLSMDTGFEREASKFMLDIAGDDEDAIKRQKNRLIWDRKKKKFIREEVNKNKIKNESGVMVSGKKKPNLYTSWLQKKKIRLDNDEENGDDKKEPAFNKDRSFKNQSYNHNRGDEQNNKFNNKFNNKSSDSKYVENSSKKQGKGKRELKRKDEILKQRRNKAKVKSFQNKHTSKKHGKKSFSNKRR